MSSKRYTEDFKVEAVKQVTDLGHSVVDRASELRGVKSESQRVAEERDLLKKRRGVLCQGVRVKAERPEPDQAIPAEKRPRIRLPQDHP